MTDPKPREREVLQRVPHVLHLPTGQRVSLTTQTPVVGSFVPATFEVTGLHAPLTVTLGVVQVLPAAGQFAALQLTSVASRGGLSLAQVPLELLRSLALRASLFVGYTMPTHIGKRWAARQPTQSEGVLLGFRPVGVGMFSASGSALKTYVVGWAGTKLNDDERAAVAAALEVQHGGRLPREWLLLAASRLFMSAPHGMQLAAVEFGLGRSYSSARDLVNEAKRHPATRELWRKYQTDKRRPKRRGGSKR